MFSCSKERFREIYQQGALAVYQQENLTWRLSAFGNSQHFKRINKPEKIGNYFS
jgi:hypothetical protein